MRAPRKLPDRAANAASVSECLSPHRAKLLFREEAACGRWLLGIGTEAPPQLDVLCHRPREAKPAPHPVHRRFHRSGQQVAAACTDRLALSQEATIVEGFEYTFCREPSLYGCICILCRLKERAGELSVRSSITIITGTAWRIARMKTPAPSRYPTWRQIVGPYILGLSGVVIAVALWSLGSKLSPNYGHAVPSWRAPVARLGVEPRGASSPAPFRFRAKSHFAPDLAAISVLVSWPARLDRAVAYPASVPRRGIAYFDFLIPFRSPPPQRFSLA
jgi:hypothetical protein